MIGFPHVIADSEGDIPGIEPGPLGWHTSALTIELQETIDNEDITTGRAWDC